MSDVLELIKQINKLGQRDINYIPYNLRNDLVLTYGTPPIPIVGLESFSVAFLQPKTKLVMSLTGKGIFVNNRNRSGLVEITLLDGSVSCAAMEVLDTLGINQPFGAMDNKTAGTGFIFASECRLIQTPPWRRSAVPGRITYTFATPRLAISHGVRIQIPF